MISAIDNDSRLIIIEYDILTNPKHISLERIYKGSKEIPVVLICKNSLPDKSRLFVDEVILNTDSENIILKKLKNLTANGNINPNGNVKNELSERELEILKLVAKGYTNKEISTELHISPHTVITHRKNITAKLEIKTIAGLTVYAILNGIVKSEEIQ